MRVDVRSGDTDAPPAGPERLLAGVAAAAGIAAWMAWTNAGRILSHYDARAHLVVARRVIDSITPGWRQIGAVWLPLPHLINLFPAQIDALYRSGAFASAVSIASLAATVWAAARLVRVLTGSPAGAVTTAGLLVLNPNVLYLSVTPMTEPMLLAANVLAVLGLYEWALRDAPPPRWLAPVLFAAMWTRYEAWLVVPAGMLAAAVARRRAAGAWRAVLLAMLPVAAWPAAAVALFLINSRLTVGSWFVSGGFFVPDPLYDGQALRSAIAVWWGTHRLSGYVIALAGLVTACLACASATWHRRPAPALVPVALFAAALLPAYAFFAGHPFRIRYMIPVVAACAVFAGIAVGLLSEPASSGATPAPDAAGRPAAGRRRVMGAVAAAALLGSSLVESPPLAPGPLLEEATWDDPARAQRAAVTRCLRRQPGEKVLASMGSLAHYMHDLAAAGFDIADFIHEGNGAIWQLALDTGPAPHARWMLVEEQSEGGDVLARRLRRDPSFTAGMARVCEGGGVALYRRLE